MANFPSLVTTIALSRRSPPLGARQRWRRVLATANEMTQANGTSLIQPRGPSTGPAARSKVVLPPGSGWFSTQVPVTVKPAKALVAAPQGISNSPKPALSPRPI